MDSYFSKDYYIKETQVICNPLGYQHEKNTEFNNSRIITI